MQADVNSTETEGGGRAGAVRSSTGIFTPAKVAPVPGCWFNLPSMNQKSETRH